VADDQAAVQLTVPASDGGSLEVLVVGPQDGLPMVFHHGTPGGLAMYKPMVAAAAERGLRTVLYGRPGYGRSTPRPGRQVADAAGDVAAILSELGARQFVTVGWSGGGPHALACACLLPGRCQAAASVAGVAPFEAGGLDWMAGMAEENVGEFTAALKGERELTILLSEFAPALMDITGDQVAASLGGLVCEADVSALRGDLADYLAVSFRTGLSAGIAGWRDDDLAFTRDWGFALAVPGGVAPVSVWQGDQDRMVPLTHGQWLARRVPAARSHFLAGVGHLTFDFGDVFDDLLGLAGAR
jgi:pimeloyl-ACP methyl ester carboxylesterase